MTRFALTTLSHQKKKKRQFARRFIGVFFFFFFCRVVRCRHQFLVFCGRVGLKSVNIYSHSMIEPNQRIWEWPEAIGV
jgi:hypothetical protein